MNPNTASAMSAVVQVFAQEAGPLMLTQGPWRCSVLPSLPGADAHRAPHMPPKEHACRCHGAAGVVVVVVVRCVLVAHVSSGPAESGIRGRSFCNFASAGNCEQHKSACSWLC
jgi:hypothetical protein